MQVSAVRRLRNYTYRSQRIGSNPGLLAASLLFSRNFLLKLTGSPTPRISIRRYLSSNKIPYLSIRPGANRGKSVEILLVATQKDFVTLPFAIEGAINSLGDSKLSRVCVIVPHRHLESCKSLVGNIHPTLSILDEETYLEKETFEMLSNSFGDRTGWALQQILKILHVSKSTSDAVLVVDADTVLLSERNWTDENGKQLLTPTWEFNLPYYRFLKELGIGNEAPKYTFVSHHMLMQPIIMNEILQFLNWSNKSALVNALLLRSDFNLASPFSIDYELYAQYFVNFHPDKIRLEKWANFGSYNESLKDIEIETILDSCKNQYASASFHKY